LNLARTMKRKLKEGFGYPDYGILLRWAWYVSGRPVHPHFVRRGRLPYDEQVKLLNEMLELDEKDQFFKYDLSYKVISELKRRIKETGPETYEELHNVNPDRKADVNWIVDMYLYRRGYDKLNKCDYCNGEGAYLAYNNQPTDCWKCEGTGIMNEGDTRKDWMDNGK